MTPCLNPRVLPPDRPARAVVTRSLLSLLLVGSLSLGSLGCDAGPDIPFVVVTAPGDEPYLGADRISVSLERGGVVLAGTEATFLIDERSLWLRDLPFGTDLRLRVEARLGALVLSRGRSMPFDFEAQRLLPKSADILLGTLGHFAQTVSLPPGATVVAGVATAEGALLSTADGSLLRYLAHGVDHDAMLTLVSDQASPSTLWASMADGLLSVHSGGLSFYRSDGMLAAELGDEALSRHPLPLQSCATEAGVLLIGSSATGLERGAVSRVVIDSDGVLQIETLVSLPLSADGSGSLRAHVAQVSTSGLEERVLVWEAQNTRLWLFDPARGEISASFDLSEPIADDATAVDLGPGLVMFAGGAGASVSNRVRLLVVQGERVAELSPSPPPLFTPRRGATAVNLEPGLSLLVGGRGEGGVPVAGAELLEVRLQELPGEITPTGSLPMEAPSPFALALDDGSVLVTGSGGAAIYFPPG